MLDDAVRDRTYRAEPLGRDVEAFLRYLVTQKDASPRTVEDYESTLARFVVDCAHLELADFAGGLGAERVAGFLHHRFGRAAPGTRRKALATLSSFFRWAVRMDKLSSNPADRLDRPRKKSQKRYGAPPERIKAIISAQPVLRERVAIALMARLGLRKDELRRLRWRDIDLQAGVMRLHAKGGKRPEVEIVFEDLLADLNRLYLESGAKPNHFLLFPRRVGNLPSHGGHGVVREYPDRPLQPSGLHRWWKRCLEQAGAADMTMHALRHTAGNEFRRATGDLELTRAFMRHETIRTTSEYYMDVDQSELVAGMRLAGERWEKQ
jgi:integrase/recombinase XerC